MKIIYNKHIPFKGFIAINLFGVIFARQEYKPLSCFAINHEAIHAAQAKDLHGYFFFYLWYILEWILRAITFQKAYKTLRFEREAKANMYNLKYLRTRKKFAWLKK